VALQVFDIDYDLKEDSTNKDFKDLYDKDAINQGIDIWISMPYRIGQGLGSTPPTSTNIKSIGFGDINLIATGLGSQVNIVAPNGLGFKPSGDNGPEFGTAVGGINYRLPIESMSKNFFIFRGGQYVFENESCAWQMIITPTGVNIGGLATPVGGAIPKSKFEVAGGATIGDTWDRVYAAPTNGLLVEGKIGGGTATPTAVLHLKAGTSAANSSPLKFTPGTALATPEDGAVEYHSSHLYFTIGSTRYQLDQQSGGGGGIAEAPIDGSQYARKDGAWSVVTSSGGTSGIWTALTGTYANSTTFTFSGTDADARLVQMSLFTCTSSGGTRRVGYVKTASNSGGTITCNVVTDSDLAAGDINFKVAYNRKAWDYVHLISIPGECVADASYPQGLWLQDIPVDSYLLPIDISVRTAAAGSGASLTTNIYSNTSA